MPKKIDYSSLADLDAIDYDKFWSAQNPQEQVDSLSQGLYTLHRLAVERDIDPEITKSLAMIPFLKKSIESGKLRFHAEIKGFNSDKNFFGFTYGLQNHNGADGGYVSRTPTTKSKKK